MKTQGIRLLDVFLLGPAMLYIARFEGPPAWLRAGMIVSGLATIIYNGNNYLKGRR